MPQSKPGTLASGPELLTQETPENLGEFINNATPCVLVTLRNAVNYGRCGSRAICALPLVRANGVMNVYLHQPPPKFRHHGSRHSAVTHVFA